MSFLKKKKKKAVAALLTMALTEQVAVSRKSVQPTFFVERICWCWKVDDPPSGWCE